MVHDDDDDDEDRIQTIQTAGRTTRKNEHSGKQWQRTSGFRSHTKES